MPSPLPNFLRANIHQNPQPRPLRNPTIFCPHTLIHNLNLPLQFYRTLNHPTTKSNPVKSITRAEMQLRRDKGLFYYCDDKFSYNHKCPNHHYFFFQIEEDDNNQLPEPQIANCLQLHIQSTTQFQVMVGNGNSLSTIGYISNLPVMIQGNILHLLVYLLPVTDADLVLGAPWLKTLGPHIADYNALSIKFYVKDNFITL
ncbi:hypothetical protein KIW84_065234 [Lathyrus oleraceus]|uniref:Uncharacterized protein n=1 Tax=Pisum sativum TaxID=3888 RepID=A0A9D4WES5_PEA|nr:hypothetical protein KIW84_065234 [Pisum sativum]